MSNQYAYISLANAPMLAAPESYTVRIARHVPGFAPDLTDSNGYGIPNIIELECEVFTQPQLDDITALGGQSFATAEDYIDWQERLANGQL
jgi:hypothetical protein